MRGIYTAAFLDRLLHQYAVIRGVEALDLGKGFDLISGTSTGAILGCAAAIGRPMSEIVRLYEENGRDIFPHRIKEGIISPVYRILEGFVGNRFIKWGDKALRRALDEQLRDVTMKDVYDRRGISLSIPTVSMESHRPWGPISSPTIPTTVFPTRSVSGVGGSIGGISSLGTRINFRFWSYVSSRARIGSRAISRRL